MAWLQATPKPPAGSKRAQREDETTRLSRIEQMKRDGITPAMPPNPAPHLITWLTEIGLVSAAGMGIAAVSWQEIVAWQHATGIELPGWTARLMRRLSVAYVAMSRKAEDETCPAPWRAPVTAREAEVELARLRSVLG